MNGKITYRFTDMITGEFFDIACETYQVHNIETVNKELGEWCTGRILTRKIIKNTPLTKLKV